MLNCWKCSDADVARKEYIARDLAKISCSSFPRPPQLTAALQFTQPQLLLNIKHSSSDSFCCHHCLHTMIPTHNLRIRNLHSRSPRPLIPCLFPECNRWFKTSSGLTYHRRSKHPPVVVDPEYSESSDSSSNSSGNNIYDLVCG